MLQCPKCGKENPDDAQLCNVCGYVFEINTTEKPIAKPKISRLAITSFVLGILSLPFFLFAAIPAIIFGIVSLFKIKKGPGQLRGKALAIAGITIPIIFVLILILWSFDADPIPKDYTIADLRSAPPECARSYELLLSMSEKDPNIPGAPAIGLSEQDVNNLEQINKILKEEDYSKICAELKANEKNILLIWQNAKKGRDIMNELDSFPEIADLTEPDLEADIKFLRNLRLLAHLYKAYVHLQSEQGNCQDAVTELIKFDSVFRKLSLNACSTLIKLVCLGVLSIDIKAANLIVNNPQVSQQSLELLAEHFTPLTKTQLSLRNSVISEHLIFKKMLDTKSGKDYSLPKTPFLKRNSSFRLYKNYCDNWINVIEQSQEPKKPELLVWPSIYPDWIAVSIDSEGKVPWIYTAYNPIGSLLIRILTPTFEKIFEIQTKLKVHYDLFQIILNKRLGKEVSLKARAYSDEYIIDVEKKKIFSPGPDGEPYTEDDIKLLINPEVLGLVPE